MVALLAAYRRVSLAEPNLYRLATGAPFPRAVLWPGLEEWAGEPFYLVTGDPALSQALWSFTHGMVVLELDDRFPPGSDLDRTWSVGVSGFLAARRRTGVPRRGRRPHTLNLIR